MSATPHPALIVPKRRPDAEQVLVCFAHAGGGTAAYRRWAEVLPPDVELVLVCYPGRESRFGTPPVQRWDDLMRDVLPAVRLLAGRQLVLFGHSFGSAVAFEVATRLEQLGTAPRALVVSASEAPFEWHKKYDGRSVTPDSTDQEMLDWMGDVGQLSEAVLAEPDLRQMAVELLRADLRTSNSYRYQPGVTVRAPLQVFYGVGDKTCGVEEAQRWKQVASGAAEVTELPGEHFYTDEVWARLPERMTAIAKATTGA